MATGEKLVNLDGLKTVHDKLSGDVTDLKSALEKYYSLSANNAFVLDDGTNLDTLVTPGNYRVTTSDHAATMLGDVPTTEAGYRLMVIEASQANRICQIAILSAKASPKYRLYKGSTWTDWLTVAYREYIDDVVVPDLKSAIDKSFSLNYANAITISASTENPVDSWDFTTPGNYKITTTDIASNVAHLPITVPGRLIVFDTSGAGRLCQLFIANVQAGYRWYIRSKHSSSAWTDWFLLNNREITDALANEGDAWN